MIYRIKPKIIGVYVNTQRKNIDEIYNEQKNKYPNYDLLIFNGGLYNSNFTPACHLKVDGKVLTKDIYKYWGYGWDSGKANVELIRDYIHVDNYLCCNCLLKDGKEEELYYNKEQLGGKRPRTAWGMTSDGEHLIYCETKVGRTLEELRTYMKELGCDSAVALDGGGSSQARNYNGSHVYSTDNPDRKVHNLICIWAEKEEQKISTPTPPPADTETPLICLDAGHYLHTAGKRCLKSIDPNETREWVLNNRMANYVEQGLANYKCNVMRVDDTTGQTDVNLTERVSKANNAKANIFVSIHHNAGINGGSGGGITTHVAEVSSQTSKILAQAIYDKTVQKTGLKGNRYKGVWTNNFQVLTKTSMPAVLGEFGFMDSTTDVPIILADDFSLKCAEGIVDAIVDVLNLERLPDKQEPIIEPTPSPPQDNKLYRVKIKIEQQVGVFSNKDNAEALVDNLKSMNINAYIE